MKKCKRNWTFLLPSPKSTWPEAKKAWTKHVKIFHEIRAVRWWPEFVESMITCSIDVTKWRVATRRNSSDSSLRNCQQMVDLLHTNLSTSVYVYAQHTHSDEFANQQRSILFGTSCRLWVIIDWRGDHPIPIFMELRNGDRRMTGVIFRNVWGGFITPQINLLGGYKPYCKKQASRLSISLFTESPTPIYAIKLLCEMLHLLHIWAEGCMQ